MQKSEVSLPQLTSSTRWVLGSERSSSDLVAGAFFRHAISLIPFNMFKKHKFVSIPKMLLDDKDTEKEHNFCINSANNLVMEEDIK